MFFFSFSFWGECDKENESVESGFGGCSYPKWGRFSAACLIPSLLIDSSSEMVLTVMKQKQNFSNNSNYDDWIIRMNYENNYLSFINEDNLMLFCLVTREVNNDQCF